MSNLGCLAVNDAFVMDEWAAAQGVRHVRLLPDGNGEFAQAMGMLVDKRELGFGLRSWRYAMWVRDGVIAKMFIEPDHEGDPFEASDADSVLRHIAPGVQPPPSVALFTKPGCLYCAQARAMLEQAGLAYDDIALGPGLSHRTLQAVAGASSTPQVFIGGRHIGGADALRQWLAGAPNAP